jgi:hypothetical protein
MDKQGSRIFKPNSSTRWVYAFAIFPFLIFLIYAISISSHTYLLSNWIGFFFLGFIGLFALFMFLSVCTEKMEVNSDTVVRKNLFKKKIIQIGDIRYVKLQAGQKGTLWLIIKTNKLRFSIGALGRHQINEAVTYILEQIRIHYPENYEDVTTEQIEVENFWKK